MEYHAYQLPMNNFITSLFYTQRRNRQVPRAWTQLGWRYQCPLCGFRARRFLPLPDEYRFRTIEIEGRQCQVDEFENVNSQQFSCPKCPANSHIRVLWLYLSRFLSAHSIKRILHLAPEKPIETRLDQIEGIQRVTVDLYRPDADCRVDIRNMSCFDDEKFDLLICSHLLEHLESGEELAYQEMFRVLQPGGTALILVPILKGLKTTWEISEKLTADSRARYYGRPEHFRVHSRSGLLEDMQSVGFQTQVINMNSLYSEKQLLRAAVPPDSVVYIGKR